MGKEKLTPWNEKTQVFCQDKQHNPPGHMVIKEPYTHTCPGCGKQTTVYPSITHM